MKPPLSISLLFNVVLVVLAVWRHGVVRDALMAREVRTATMGSSSRPGPGRPVHASSDGAARGLWDSVESKSARELVENLRAAGCPEQTIQDLVTMRICRDFRRRVLELLAQEPSTAPYWKYRSSAADHDRQGQIRDLRDEMHTELEELFGVAASQIQGRLAGWPESMWGDSYLPLEKTAQLRDIAQRYRRLEDQDRAEQGELPSGYQDSEVTARKLELERQQQEEIRSVLTPEEYEQYQLRQSPAAKYVQRQLPEAKSEAEYRRMVQVAAKFGMGKEPIAPALVEGDTEDPAKLAADREAAFRQRLKEEFGEDRIAEQERLEKEEQAKANQERERQEMMDLAQSAGATVEEASAFFARIRELQPELEKRFGEAEKLAVRPDQKEAFKAMVEAELERIASEIMGEEKAKSLIRKAVEKGM
jgi:cytochrome c-type biogenesis protein CcmH/NrfF